MTTDEKIRLGMQALSTTSVATIVAAMGIREVKPPFMDEIGGPLSG